MNQVGSIFSLFLEKNRSCGEAQISPFFFGRKFQHRALGKPPRDLVGNYWGEPRFPRVLRAKEGPDPIEYDVPNYRTNLERKPFLNFCLNTTIPKTRQKLDLTIRFSISLFVLPPFSPYPSILIQDVYRELWRSRYCLNTSLSSATRNLPLLWHSMCVPPVVMPPRVMLSLIGGETTFPFGSGVLTPNTDEFVIFRALHSRWTIRVLFALMISSCCFLSARSLLTVDEIAAMTLLWDRFPDLREVPAWATTSDDGQNFGASWTRDFDKACASAGYHFYGLHCSSAGHIDGLNMYVLLLSYLLNEWYWIGLGHILNKNF